MFPEPWLYGALALSAVLYVAAVVYVRRRLLPSAGGTRADPGADRPVEALEGSSVACPECGTDNEIGYRYCRACVSELPGAVTRTRSRTPPLGRGLF